MKSDRIPPTTIEDLIRLKRAERPRAEFWAEFNQELRAKQLAALVQKHPWWQTLPSASFRVLTRFRLPLGAAAVVAATFYSIRDHRAPEVTPEVYPVASNVTPSTVSAPLEQSSYAGLSEAVHVAVALPAAVSVESRGSSVALTEAPESTLAVSTSEAPLVPIFASGETQTSDAEISSSPLLAVNLGSVTASGNTGSTHLLGARPGFESRGLPTRAAIEPLQQMSSPGETRRARLMTAMVSMASMEASALTTARAASKIDEEDLYDQVQRFGARGDRLHVKF
jgi:hypothetical protein